MTSRLLSGRRSSARQGSVQEVQTADEQILGDFGYDQELQREWSALHNFGVSFSIISIVTGITTLFRSVVEMGMWADSRH